MDVSFFKISRDGAEYEVLCEHSGRLAALLDSAQPGPQDGFVACLDDLLGAVYSLFYAVHRGYVHRPHQLAADDIKAVAVRARDMHGTDVRTDGPWTAGYYFNSALFRIGSVYHRALVLVVGCDAKLKKILRCTEAWFKSSQGRDWANSCLKKVNNEANGLKHREGVYAGRSVTVRDSVEAVGELLDLLEAWQATGGKAACDATRAQRIAGIDHVVYEYANLLSAAWHSLNGPAPARTNADDAFLLGCRKIGDFLMDVTRRDGDEILATDYLPNGAARTWRLPTWQDQWRAPMNDQLAHVSYARVRKPQSWNHARWVPILQNEFQDAWRVFWASVTDPAYKAEYEKQIARQKERFAGTPVGSIIA